MVYIWLYSSRARADGQVNAVQTEIEGDTVTLAQERGERSVHLGNQLQRRIEKSRAAIRTRKDSQVSHRARGGYIGRARLTGKGSGLMTTLASTHISLKARRRRYSPHDEPRSCRPAAHAGVKNRARRVTCRLGLRLPPTPKPPRHVHKPVSPRPDSA